MQTVELEDSDTSVRRDQDAWSSAWRRLPSYWRLAVGLVAVQLVVRGWAIGGSYYYQDDFAHLEMARRLGWSAEYLVRDYGGHLEIGQYALIWLMSHVTGDSFLPAVMSVLVMQAMASLLLFALLRTVFGDSPLILLGWSLYLFTPLALAWSAWWAAAVQTLPLQIATLSVLLAMAKLHLTGSRRWALAAVVAHAAGLLFWQKALLILPIALAFQVLVLSDGGLSSRMRSLLRSWRTWLVHGAVVGGYLVLYLSVVADEDRISPTRAQVWHLVENMVGRTLVPGLIGGPWHADGADKTLYPLATGALFWIVMGMFAALVYFSFRVSGAAAAYGWLFLCGYVSADLVLLLVGRSDWLGLLARDPRYVADALPIVTLGMVAAFRGMLGPASQRRQAARWLDSRLDLSTGLKGVALVGLSGLVTTVQLAPAVQYDYPRNYSHQLIAQVREHPGSLIDQPAPVEISARVTVSGLLRALGHDDVDFDTPSTDMALVDGFGNVRPIIVLPDVPEQEGPEPECGWRLGDIPTEVMQVGPGYGRVARVAFQTSQPRALTLILDGQEQTLDLEGDGAAHFRLPDHPGTMALASDPPGLCARAVIIGSAWVAEE